MMPLSSEHAFLLIAVGVWLWPMARRWVLRGAKHQHAAGVLGTLGMASKLEVGNGREMGGGDDDVELGLISDGRQACSFVSPGFKTRKVMADAMRNTAHAAAACVEEDKRYLVKRGCVARSTLRAVLEGLESCPYFGLNREDGTGTSCNITDPYFRGTRGFSVTFRDTRRAAVAEHLPFLAPLLDTMLLRTCNAFYLTVLECNERGQEYHVDEYLSSVLHEYRPADVVSIVYLQCGSEAADEHAAEALGASTEASPGTLVGGDLVILNASPERLPGRQQRGAETVDVLARVAPQPGTMVQFDGTLVHCVMPFTFKGSTCGGEGCSSGGNGAGDEAVSRCSPRLEPRRVSVVCEQYKLRRRQLTQVPRFAIFDQTRNMQVNLDA